jgi:phosphoribosylaminoimidazolecarboxamide formyltransferase / IMP cyclohydrolase
VRALISVWDKTGVGELARGLASLGAELVASGGTASYLEEAGLEVTRVEEIVNLPQLFGGRVKTLHPKIHAAILARNTEEDLEALARLGIEPFDLVCVNFYPFAQVAGRYGVQEEEAVEMIDIGGPAMLRGAAKNFVRAAPLCRPDQYGPVLDELRATGVLSRETRRRLAAEAFSAMAASEAAIASWFAERETFPRGLTLSFTKALDLAYGENPHQQAAYYTEDGARRHLLSRVEQLHGKELSFNNLGDLNAARVLLEEFEVPGCVIVKHAGPCGAALATTIEEAYERALSADPLSAYGGVVALNREVGSGLGDRLAEQFVEALVAPAYDEGALAALRSKPATRVLLDSERRRRSPGERDYRRVLGGLLVQERDAEAGDRTGMRVVCGRPDEAEWGDLLFAWRVCKHVRSNAIVLAKGLQTVGIGAGQTSRVDAVRIAVEKARELGHSLTGAVLASDAFFPFADGPGLALEAGVRAIVQPGGSKRDDEVIEAVQEAGATMVFSGRRHFRH